MNRKVWTWIAVAAVLVAGATWFTLHTRETNAAIAACQQPLTERAQAMADLQAQARASLAAYKGTGPQPYMALPSRETDELLEKCAAVGVYIEPIYELERMPSEAETYAACLEAAADAGVSGTSFGCTPPP